LNPISQSALYGHTEHFSGRVYVESRQNHLINSQLISILWLAKIFNFNKLFK